MAGLWCVTPSPHLPQRITLANVVTQFAILIWWFVSARKWFKGPKVNLEHLMLGREDQAAGLGDVIEGKEDFGDRSSGSHDGGVPGEMPPGKQVGDMKPDGL